MRTPMYLVGKRKSKNKGFTYVMVLVAVIVIGILAEAAGLLSSRIIQADKELELLFRGQAYLKAIESYYLAGQGARTFPRSLEDLVKDPRFPNRRHIRSLYPEPLGDGEQKWQLIASPDGGIAGVVSVAAQEPLKQANFPKGLEKFENATSYSQWIFEYVPKQVPGIATVPSTPATSASPPVLKTN